MWKSAMRVDHSRQIKKSTYPHARIPHFGKSGTRYLKGCAQMHFTLTSRGLEEPAHALRGLEEIQKSLSLSD
jgi:hypothetical protein